MLGDPAYESYLLYGGEVLSGDEENLSLAYADGNIVTTARDLANWAYHLWEQTIFSMLKHWHSPRFILPKSFGEKKISGKILKQYTKPFANKTQRNGTLAFARSLLNDQGWFEELWNNKQVLLNKHILFIWGMKDPVIKPHNLEKFSSGFPNSKIIKLEASGHFPQEEESEKVAMAIRDFL